MITFVPRGTIGLFASTAIVWLAVGYAPLAVGPPDHLPQQIEQLQYPLVTTFPRDSPTRTVLVSVTVYVLPRVDR